MRPNPVFGGGLTAHRVLCDDSRSCRNYLQAPAKYAADDPFCDHQYTARRLASQSGAAEQTPPYRDSIASFEAALNFTNDAQSRKYVALAYRERARAYRARVPSKEKAARRALGRALEHARAATSMLRQPKPWRVLEFDGQSRRAAGQTSAVGAAQQLERELDEELSYAI